MFQAARRVALILILAMGVTAPALAQSGPGQGDFERGEALLAKGEFQQALEAYQAAAKAAPDNPAYGQRVAVVQQVLRIEGIAADASHAQWAQAVQMLHGFYLSNGLAERALPNDRKLHEREGSNATGYALATTLADLKRYAEAADVLSPLLAKGEDAGLRIMRAILRARQEKPDEARADLDKTPGVLKDPGQLYNRACAYALLGETAKAGADLRKAFAHTPAAELEASKEWAKKDPDLVSLRGTPVFAKALETQSAAGASSCGDCGGCDEAKKAGHGEEGCEDGEHPNQ